MFSYLFLLIIFIYSHDGLHIVKISRFAYLTWSSTEGNKLRKAIDLPCLAFLGLLNEGGY